ncbi:F-box/FBD/LRR-repeat protein, partial [Trifolium pratense]
MDDCISELLDEILSYILTRLSMKDLLKTSILSRRWCTLWGLRRDIYFDIHGVLGSEDELTKNGYLIDVDSRCIDLKVSRDEFVKRVDQFLKNFPGTKIDSFLVNFSLSCEQRSSIDQWISFAIARGVERINLLFQGDLSTLNIYTNVLKRINFSIIYEEDLNAFAPCATFPQLEIMRLKIFPMSSYECEEYEEFDLMLILNILQASPLLQKLSIM